MAVAKAVGIDLGTTNSAVAWVDESGRTAMVRNSEGDTITPSVVFFDDAEIVVGKDARRMAPLYPDRVAQWVKRDMGQPVYSRPIRGEYMPPEVIQACILRKLKADLFMALGPTAKAVITVPAYFDELRRKVTADAGEMAGLTVLDIVNEPTAAALGFGETLGYLSAAGKPLDDMVVMIYDLGGGTFDATLLRLAPADVRTLATDGDVQLGGHDWDQRLVRHAAETFKASFGCDPREDDASLARLFETAAEAKHTLTARSQTTMRVEHAGQSLDVPITRQQFEEMTADLLERTAFTSRELLRAAGLQWRDVSRILLVGGSTRMPIVSQMLQQMTGIAPDRTVNPDEAVSRGAAIYAHWLLSSPEHGGTGAGFAVTNVNAHSLGIEGVEPQTLRKVNVVLIPRNSPLPAKRKERFVTKVENQRSIVVQVLEGESRQPRECVAIGRTVIRDLPPGLPQGWPVEVTFQYAANGRLAVRAAVPGTHREETLELERDSGLSREGIARWNKLASDATAFNKFDALVQEVVQLSPHKETAEAQLPSSSGIASSPMPLALQPIPTPEALREPLPVSSVPAHEPAGVDFHSPEMRPAARRGPKKFSLTRVLISVVAYGISAVAGLWLGYLLIRWLVPDAQVPAL